MIKALLLVFEPVQTWDRIADSKRGFWFVLLINLLPLLAITGLAEGYALTTWGKWEAVIEKNKLVPPGEAWFYVAVQGGLSLIMVFALAWMIRVVNESFHGDATFSEAFSLIAYSLSPLFTVRLIDMLPGVSGYYSWVSLIIGAVLVLGTFYGGMPRMLRLGPANAFGHYFICILLVLVVAASVRFFSLAALGGKIPKLTF
jgi:uncharacterized membrane protein YidH (DUF202 family)